MCKAYNKNKCKCKQPGVINGYCMIHFISREYKQFEKVINNTNKTNSLSK